MQLPGKTRVDIKGLIYFFDPHTSISESMNNGHTFIKYL